MWSHYGGRSKGFCLEFCLSAEAFKNRIHKVHYIEMMPVIDVVKILLPGDSSVVQELFCTKSSVWAYEKEWRAIHKNVGAAYTYPADALTGIYFGPDIDQQMLEIICLVICGQNPNVRLWKGTRSRTEFRVVFEEFTYTSYIEAKSQGLR